MTLLVAAMAALATTVSPTAIENVAVIEPGKTTIRQNMTVLMDNGRIAAVGSANAIKIPPGTVRIDGTGKYLIPGLWDMHVHWYDEPALGLFTANGITGVRIMFGKPIHLEWRTRIAKGDLIGPRMVVGSPIVDGAQPNWPGSIAFPLDGDAQALVTKLKSEKWDFIKVYSDLTAEAFYNIAKEANRQKMPFAGHLPNAVDPVDAAQSGQRSMEHFEGLRAATMHDAARFRALLQEEMRKGGSVADQMDRTYASMTAAQQKSDPEQRQRMIDGLGKSGMWQCPTLTVSRAYSFVDQEWLTGDPNTKYLSKKIQDQWLKSKNDRLAGPAKGDLEYWRDDWEKKRSLVAPLKKAGSKFLAGTDCLNPYVVPGFSLHDELALLVENGLTPTEALESATTNPARFFHEERRWGTIAKGKIADAVLLERNPLDDIHNTKSIVAVFQHGRSFLKPELDAILKANEGR